MRQIEELACQGYSQIPLAKEIPSDILTPVRAFLLLQQKSKKSFLLESAEGGEQVGRYSFIGVDPFAEISCENGCFEFHHFETGVQERVYTSTPFVELDKIFQRYRAPKLPYLPPIQGGAAGYVSYNSVRYLENIPVQTGGTGAKDIQLLLFRSMVCFDHLRHRIFVISHCQIKGKDLSQAVTQGREEIRQMIAILESTTTRPFAIDLNIEVPDTEIPGMSALMGEHVFCEGVKKLKTHIRAGDIFQGVLSDRFEFPIKCDPILVYRALRFINPSPYLFYLSFGNEHLLGASPEMLTRCFEKTVETCPIAGTRPRGEDEKADKKLEKELLASVKERAEHLMLVDLGRNDVGRVAKIGTVEVTDFMKVERFSHVMHLVSRVQGVLRPDLSPWDAFAACFPAGTLTGAPKIRAMEIIAGIEPECRGTYGGGVFCYDYSGHFNSCITIRSLYMNQERGYISAGAGIVADSRPKTEYQEVLNKAKAVKKAVRVAQEIQRLEKS